MTGLALSPGDVPPGLRVFLDGVANNRVYIFLFISS